MRVPVGGASETDKATENQPSTTAAAWQTPVAYAANGPHFAPLAAFIEAHTGQRPGTAIDVLETPGCTVLGYGPAVPGAANEVLVMRTAGEVAWRTTLGKEATETAIETAPETAAQTPEPPPGQTPAEAAARPDGPRFCTFGPILYALGLPGEVVAWALPGA